MLAKNADPGFDGRVVPFSRRVDDRKWYAVICAPLKERMATRVLIAQGIDVFWPHYLAQVRHGRRRGYAFRSWFPRYLFVADGPSFSARAVNSTLGVSTIVYLGEDLLSIPFEIMLEIKSMADPSGLIPNAKLAPDNMVAIKGENFAECLRRLGGFRAKVWAAGMMSEVKAA